MLIFFTQNFADLKYEENMQPSSSIYVVEPAMLRIIITPYAREVAGSMYLLQLGRNYTITPVLLDSNGNTIEDNEVCVCVCVFV